MGYHANSFTYTILIIIEQIQHVHGIIYGEVSFSLVISITIVFQQKRTSNRAFRRATVTTSMWIFSLLCHGSQFVLIEKLKPYSYWDSVYGSDGLPVIPSQHSALWAHGWWVLHRWEKAPTPKTGLRTE